MGDTTMILPPTLGLMLTSCCFLQTHAATVWYYCTYDTAAEIGEGINLRTRTDAAKRLIKFDEEQQTILNDHANLSRPVHMHVGAKDPMVVSAEAYPALLKSPAFDHDIHKVDMRQGLIL